MNNMLKELKEYKTFQERPQDELALHRLQTEDAETRAQRRDKEYRDAYQSNRTNNAYEIAKWRYEIRFPGKKFPNALECQEPESNLEWVRLSPDFLSTHSHFYMMSIKKDGQK